MSRLSRLAVLAAVAVLPTAAYAQHANFVLFGTDNPAAGQTMPVYDAIQFRALGVVGQPAIDWQNRPTFQQVIEFPRHRPR